MNTEEEINSAIKKLIRSCTTQELENQLKWHKMLYEIGEPALPKIDSTIKSYHTSNLDVHSKHVCISGLMRLMHDIDETAALKLSDELIKSGCAPVTANHLKTLNEFSITNFKCYQINNIKIFEEKNLSPKYSIQHLLQKWFENVPAEDLIEIDRIYIKRQDNQPYAGNYMPVLFSINLIWFAPSSRLNPLSWLMTLVHERTLYHEIGHHVPRHRFGNDFEQEKEANQYASMLMKKSHPVLSVILGAIAKALRKLGVDSLIRCCKDHMEYRNE